MFPSFPSTASLVLVGMVWGCSSHESSTSPGQLDIIGFWNQGARLRDTINNQTHIHSGYFWFKERGAGFDGTGQQSGLCSGASGDYAGPLATGTPFGITSGEEADRHVSFHSDLCTYEGTLSTDREHIEGTARCAYTEGGVNFVWTGDWLANREQ